MGGPWARPVIVPHLACVLIRIVRWRNAPLGHKVAATRGTTDHDGGVATLGAAPEIRAAGGQQRKYLIVDRIEPLQGEVSDRPDRAKAPLRPQHVERDAPLV